MSERDPRRLLDPQSGLAAGLRAVLEADRDELPDTARLDALARRLGPEFVGPGVEPPAAPHASGFPGVPAATTLAAVGAVVVAASALVWWASAPRPSSRPAPDPAPPAVEAAGPVVAPERLQAPVAGAEAPLGDAAANEQTRPASARRRTNAQQRRAVGAKHAAAPDDPLAELALLDEAQRALKTTPAAALAHAERHRARFPHGQYAQEREVIAIDALLLLERRDEARGRAARFLQRFPDSGHARRVSEWLQRTSTPAPDR